MKMKGREKIGKYLDLAKELKKTRKHEGDSGTNCRHIEGSTTQKKNQNNPV